MHRLSVDIAGVLIGRFDKLSDKKREDERSRIAYLLRQAIPNDTPVLDHLPNGRPILSSTHNISISHTGQWGAIYIVPPPFIPGIDIEEVSDRALRVCGRFMNDKEMELLTSASLEQQQLLSTIIWSAKETAFKIFNPPDANLKARFGTSLPSPLPTEGYLFSFGLIYSEPCVPAHSITIQAFYTEGIVLTCAQYRPAID